MLFWVENEECFSWANFQDVILKVRIGTMNRMCLPSPRTAVHAVLAHMAVIMFMGTLPSAFITALHPIFKCFEFPFELCHSTTPGALTN